MYETISSCLLCRFLKSHNLVSDEFTCIDEISSIVAMLQVDNVFVKPYLGSNAIKARVEKRNFEVEEGDLITLLNVFTAFGENIDNAKSWCNQHFINYKALRRACEIKSQILRMLERFEIQTSSCNGNYFLVNLRRNVSTETKCTQSTHLTFQ